MPMPMVWERLAPLPEWSARLLPLLVLFLVGASPAITIGAPIRDPEAGDFPPIIDALLGGDLSELRDRIAGGEDVNARDAAGRTALHYASVDGNLEAVKTLIKARAKVDPVDRFGNTPLSNAVFESRGRGDMIRLLLRSGADPNRKNNHGVSPRELAQKIKNFDVARFLP